MGQRRKNQKGGSIGPLSFASFNEDLKKGIIKGHEEKDLYKKTKGRTCKPSFKDGRWHWRFCEEYNAERCIWRFVVWLSEEEVKKKKTRLGRRKIEKRRKQKGSFIDFIQKVNPKTMIKNKIKHKVNQKDVLIVLNYIYFINMDHILNPVRRWVFGLFDNTSQQIFIYFLLTQV